MTQRDEVISLTCLDLRALYVEIVTEVKKALSLKFGRRSSMYTVNIRLQIIQGKSCGMYLVFRIFFVKSMTSRALSFNVKWLILLDVQILNSRLYTGLY